MNQVPSSAASAARIDIANLTSDHDVLSVFADPSATMVFGTMEARPGDIPARSRVYLAWKGSREHKHRGLTVKVSEKGAISVYGLQRMPVTLYVEQWERLLEHADAIREFAKANSSKLTRKDRSAAQCHPAAPNVPQTDLRHAGPVGWQRAG